METMAAVLASGSRVNKIMVSVSGAVASGLRASMPITSRLTLVLPSHSGASTAGSGAPSVGAMGVCSPRLFGSGVEFVLLVTGSPGRLRMVIPATKSLTKRLSSTAPTRPTIIRTSIINLTFLFFGKASAILEKNFFMG